MAGKSRSLAVLLASLLAGALAVTASKPAPPKRPDSDARPVGTPATTAPSPSSRPAGRPGLPLPPAPAPGWRPENEWILTGNYAETCSDPPLCPGLFGAPSSSGTCRKIMIFQVTHGRYHNTNLGGLTAAVVLQSPEGAPLSPWNRADWPLCDLLISDQADSAQAAGMEMALGAMLSGAGGPPFNRVERAPVEAGFSATRVIAEAAERMRLYLHPGESLNKIRPPDLNNLGTTFRFLGPMYIYEADTVFVAATPSPSRAGADPRDWRYSGRSAVVSQFAWNSEVAYREVGDAAGP